MTGPCADWPTDPDCTFGIEPDPAKRSPEQAAAVSAATEVLWALTAGVFGICPLSVRPCRADCPATDDGFPPRGIPPGGMPAAATGTPALIAGTWLNIPCGCGRAKCGCAPMCEVRLPGPVASVDEVWLGGSVLDPSSYRVDNAAWLVRTDGGCWPTCQNMAAPITAPGTWQVNYQQGNPIPLGAQRANTALAAELLKACTNASNCRLPSNATTITRDGVSIVIDTTALLDAGRTGIAQVDLWLGAVNPNGLRSRPAVYSPDLPRMREVVA